MQAATSATGQSLIDDELTPMERKVLAAYRSPTRHIRRQIRLSVQYAVATGLFAYLSVSTGQPLYGIVVYVVFLLWMAARLFGAWRIAGTTPKIIEKYEARIADLRGQVAEKSRD